ncbi:MupA/Atu3671 family FMN-dependent luciferase-like monooxygenase [Actinophytocola sediminis]
MTSLSCGQELDLTEDDPGDAVAALHRAAQRFPEHAVVTVTEDGTVRQTYPQLLARARGLLGGLVDRGARPGDPVVLTDLPLPDFFATFWACLLGGLVPVPMTDSARLGHVRELLGDPLVITQGDPLDERPVAGGEPRPDAPALLILSSGSTGRPKAVPLTHRALALGAAGCGRAVGLRPEHVTLNWLPIDHSGALLLYHVNSVFAGATNVHVATDLVLAEPVRWLELLAEYRVAHSWAPTFGFQLVVNALAGSDRHWDLSRVVTLMCGGEQISHRVATDFLAATRDFGVRRDALVSAWGMAETASAVTYGRLAVRQVLSASLGGDLVFVDETTDERDRIAFVPVGTPVAGVALRVVGPDGAVLPERRIGRLQVSSARVTPGYLGDEEADRAAFPNGDRTWLDSGDLAFLDGGAVTITGRAKDVVIINGHNHYCHEIEDVVRAAGPAGAAVAACGVPNPATGSEDLVVFIAGTGDARAVRQAVFERLRLSCRVVFLTEQEFPRTPSGKVRRGVLRERALAGHYDTPAAPTPPRESNPPTPRVQRSRPASPTLPTRASMTDRVSAIMSDVVGSEVDRQTPFFDLGLTSIALAGVRARLAAELGTEIPVTALFRHPTVDRLAAYLAEGSSPRPRPVVPSGKPDRRVAIIGMSGRFPGARDLDQFWSNLRAGVDSVTVFPSSADDPDLRPVCGVLDDVDGFDAGFFGISPREAALTDPAHRLFLECCYHALEHAGYAGQESGYRVGVFAGSGMHLYGHQDGAESGLVATIGAEPDFLASRVAYRLGLTGPAIGVRTACSTSLVAVHLAVRALLDGDADLAVAGAAAVHLPQETGYRYEPGSILSASGRCRAFDSAADGTVGGNGVAAVVLKPLAAALADGDPVHAVILGSAVNNDGRDKVGFTAPSVTGQAAVVRAALDRAGVSAETVTYVEAHGTGTELGDPVEFAALTEAFRASTDRVGYCALGSVKPNIGHLDTCAGMAGLIKAVLMVKYGELVPTINLERPNPALALDASPFTLATESRNWTVDSGPRRAGVSALGVGGTNAHVVLEEPPSVGQEPVADGPVLVPLSAADPAALATMVDRFRPPADTRVADVARTLTLGRRHLPFRATAVGRSAEELVASLTVGGPAVGPVVFAFSGQGRVPDLAALHAAFPVVRAVLEECARSCPGLLTGSGPAQPTLFACQVAMVELWRAVGVSPAVVTGHSLGEYAALYAAGALSLADGMRLVLAREVAMSGLEPGGMLAVNTELATARRVATSTGVEIAAVNGTAAVVLSGAEEAIAAAEVAGGGRRLPGAIAFHSRLVEPALPALRRAGEEVDWRPLRVPLVRGVDGVTLPVGTVLDAQALCRHAREPVRFDLVLAALGERDVVELGAGEVLAPFGRRLTPESRWHTGRAPDPVTGFLTAVGNLYRGGIEIDWSALMVAGARRIPLPAYPFQRENPPQEAAEADEAALCALTARLLGVPVTSVTPDSTFVGIGADSLTLMSMVRELNETNGTTISVRRLFTDLDTPRKLAASHRTARPPTTQQPPAPPAVTAPAPPVAPVGQPVDRTEFGALVERQLALAERMVDRISTLMTDQLAAFGTPAPERTSAPQPPAPDPAPAIPAPTPRPVPEAPHPVASPPGRRTADFSLYFFGDYPDHAETDKYQLITTAARFADQHGFHALWLPERHFHSFGALFPNPSVLAAALAAQTERVRLHAGSVVLPLHHPIRVAEEWSVVDNLSGGRVGLCVASGWHATDFVLAPENYGRHRDLMYSRLDTVRRLWAGEEITATSGSGDQVPVRLHPRPLQDQPPMYVAVVGNPESYRLAAEHDLGVVTNLMAQDVDQLAANIAGYRRARAELGRDPGRVVVLVHTYLGDDLDRVRQQAFRPFVDYLRSSLSLFNQVTNSLGIDVDLDATDADDVDFLLERAYQRYCESRALIGTRDSVTPVLRRLVDAGADEIACFVDFGVPREQVIAGLSTLDDLRRAHQRAAEPLTPAQRRIWFLDRLYPDQLIYHEPKAIRFTGPVDVPALVAALRRVVDRQPALRTVFRDEAGEPYRLVLPTMAVDCPLVERTGVPEEQALRAALADHTVLDLATGPLLTATLLRLAEHHHLLVLNAHHIVFDSASTAVLLRDLATYYRAFPGDPELPALPEPEERTADPAEHLDYWRAQLAGARSPRLPTDHPRPPVRSGAGAALTHHLDADLADPVDRLSREHGVTMFMTLLGAIAATLGRFADQDDLVLGTVVANRGRAGDQLVGLLLDTVAVRVDLTGDPSLTELATRVRDTTLSAFEHPVPFDELVRALNPERDPGSNPLFQVVVEYENETVVDFAPALTVTPLDVPTDRAPFDLTLYLTRHSGGLRLGIEYDTDLFTVDTVRRMVVLVEQVLRRAVGTPSARLSELTAPTGADLAELTRWQGAAAPAADCLHTLVERQVDRTPDAVALVDGNAELTYRELDDLANQLANSLLANGIGRGDLVAVQLPRGMELIASILGVLKSGAAYLPLDPSLPAARVEHLLLDSGAHLLPAVHTDTSRPNVPVSPADLAYCVYTSGSTGRPKGVLVPHCGPANVVRWQAAQHPPLRTLQWTSPAFDVSVQEIFSTLAAGATLVLVDDRTRHDPAAVVRVLREHRVQRIFLPYTPLKYLLESPAELPDLRVVVSAGEAFVLTAPLRGFFAAHPDCVLYNQYGPTEGSIIVTAHQVDPAGPARPSIGRPIDGVTVEVLDDRQLPVPAGAIGELYLGGTAVAAGYLGRPQETATAFVADQKRPGARRYRTGDLGRWRGDGTVEFLGRRDDQVKIRGNRVEPGEVALVLGDLDGVRDSAVLARRDGAGETELVAYVVLAPGQDLDVLPTRLRTLLPDYLVPSRWLPVPELPVNANGKLDTAALAELAVEPAGTAPVSELERTLHDLWCAELGREQLPVDRSFFALGGHSLSAVRLLNRVTERVGRPVTMAEFFRAPTIRGLAARLTATVPTTSRQRRLWRRHHEQTGPAVYNVSHRIDLRGRLDVPNLERSLSALVARHDALRTRLIDERTQEFRPPFPISLPVTTIPESTVDDWCQTVIATPFALDREPLLRAQLASVDHDHHVLVLVAHHIVCDGWSFGVLWRDLSALCAGETLPPAPRFADHVHAEADHLSGHRLAELSRFWRDELAGADLTLPLPADHARPATLTSRGARHDSAVPSAVADRVRATATEAGSTPYAVLAAAFAVWAARLSGRPEVVIPTSVANRGRQAHESLVGMLGDALPLRVPVHRADAHDLVRQVSTTLYTALDHSDLPLTEVVAQVPGARLPNILFTVVTDPPPALTVPGVAATVRELTVPGLARNELYLRLTLGETIAVTWEYATDLFTARTVADWDTALHATLTELTLPRARPAGVD